MSISNLFILLIIIILLCLLHYEESEPINFLKGSSIYYQSNGPLWHKLSKHIKKFINISREIMNNNDRYVNQKYTVLKNISSDILNTYHAFIHTVPHNEIKKFNESLIELERLLNKEIDIVHRNVSLKNKDIDINTIFHYKNQPLGYTKSPYEFFPNA